MQQAIASQNVSTTNQIIVPNNQTYQPYGQPYVQPYGGQAYNQPYLQGGMDQGWKPQPQVVYPPVYQPMGSGPVYGTNPIVM